MNGGVIETEAREKGARGELLSGCRRRLIPKLHDAQAGSVKAAGFHDCALHIAKPGRKSPVLCPASGPVRVGKTRWRCNLRLTKISQQVGSQTAHHGRVCCGGTNASPCRTGLTFPLNVLRNVSWSISSAAIHQLWEGDLHCQHASLELSHLSVQASDTTCN